MIMMGYVHFAYQIQSNGILKPHFNLSMCMCVCVRSCLCLCVRALFSNGRLYYYPAVFLPNISAFAKYTTLIDTFPTKILISLTQHGTVMMRMLRKQQDSSVFWEIVKCQHE